MSRTILDAIPAEEVPINASDISSTNSGSVTNSKASSEGGAVESEVYREMQARMPRLFARLYRHVFMSREVWSVHPHVHETLRALCVYKDHSSNHNNRPSGRSNSNGYRDRGQWHDVPLQLGIISNSDDRTAPLLEGMYVCIFILYITIYLACILLFSVIFYLTIMPLYISIYLI